MATVLRGTDMDQLAELVWLLAQSQGKPNARAAILQAVAAFLDAEFVASFVWEERAGRSIDPQAFNMESQLIEAYQKHFYQVGLIAPVMREVRAPARVDCHVPRSAMLKSEFYNDFLQPADMEHGLNVFFFDGDRDIGDLRVWRSKGSKPFSQREERLLSTLQPYFQKAFSSAPTPSQRLSLREAEVAELVAQGASDKEVARRLDIAFSTVRTHLKNAMAKLECQNRTQLARCL
ncbi:MULTISPECIES: helix-turn-helix transcriptional regulator [Pseudomonas]|uniref:Helix-turn-helix transcriptional regulator n=1 Tax=Pseudomonas monteilii TaxID=76759 RepID=A0A7X3JU50_9PSED|nr:MULTISPECIES: helix-turn-helix transcriptional regulator [Pseudomonas]MBA6136047.1 helix-turn-helix transcriptional regulator [Pseudomonas monteilii]MCA4078568.1 helix-turn-helix transcriptional regulator [Pseudomonas kurunegalensis]MDT3748399.1 helix-turn-helix transcriptional regulator [Pseudomonas kurunegalensis]MVF52313.1 helix-turn-helix transcriptional regulator [Pseudomonas monteilii]